MACMLIFIPSIWHVSRLIASSTFAPSSLASLLFSFDDLLGRNVSVTCAAHLWSVN
jgi:hypothetical protein